jgi:glycosyltransferase involved in cell wall biosynthesis
MPSFARLVTNSEGLARILKSEFVIPGDKVLAAPNGADDPGVFQVKHPNGDRLRVGYVGHLYAGRGIELILALARTCQWADFHLIGGTEKDVDYWRSKATDLNNVSFHGFVPPATAEQYRQDCDILLAPYPPQTLTKRMRDASAYMSPLKLFEYMASGRAIVCADHPVLQEIVNDQTAFLCSPDNLEDWVSALQRLRDDPDLRRRLGENARATFLRDFTRTARASRILAGITVRQKVNETEPVLGSSYRADH